MNQLLMKVLIMIGISLLLSSCGFRLRSATEVPTQLHTLYLKTSSPYSPLVTQLKATLQSLSIKLAKNRCESIYTLNLTGIHFSQSNPAITTTNLAVSITYSLSVNIQITAANNKTVTSIQKLYATRSISQNPSQVYTPGAATLAQQELRRDIISQIYYVLVSKNTYRKLHSPYYTKSNKLTCTLTNSMPL